MSKPQDTHVCCVNLKGEASNRQHSELHTQKPCNNYVKSCQNKLIFNSWPYCLNKPGTLWALGNSHVRWKFGFIKLVDKDQITTVKDLEGWRFEWMLPRKFNKNGRILYAFFPLATLLSPWLLCPTLKWQNLRTIDSKFGCECQNLGSVHFTDPQSMDYHEWTT